MERFWRTLREGCLDFIGTVTSLHDVNVRLYAFLDTHYHQAAHSSLIGQTPSGVYRSAPKLPDSFDELKLRDALTTRVRRRVRRDTTVSLEGIDYELDGGHLAGRLVFICRCLVDLKEKPWVELEGKRLELHPVDAVRNARRARPPRRSPTHDDSMPRHPAFDPPKALLDRAVGRAQNPAGGKS